jgi:phosphoribosyl 1,2-cyclic phosphodiesterase
VSISLRFLGTGGARFVVARQIRASGGIWMRFGATQIHLDPGPGALVRALSTVPPQRPADLDAIVLSHKHLDHAGDVNAVIEAMVQGGWHPRGALVAPRDTWEEESILLHYARRFVPNHIVVEERGGPYAINDVELRASIRHRHPVETYGLHFRYRGTTVSYLPCTRYFDALIEDYRAHAPDVLIVNVLRFADTMDVDHLTFDQAKRLIAGIAPKAAIMTHFGTKMLERDPRKLAFELEDELGVRVYAAYDGWTFDAPMRGIDVA